MPAGGTRRRVGAAHSRWRGPHRRRALHWRGSRRPEPRRAPPRSTRRGDASPHHRRAGRRHASATSAARSARSTCRRRWDPAAAVSRRGRRRLAGPVFRQLHALARAAGRARARIAGALPQQPATERSPTSPGGAGLAVEFYGLGVGAGRLRQRRPRGPLRDRARAEPPVSGTRATGSFTGRDGSARASAIPASRPAPPGSTTTATAASTSSSPTTWSGRSTRTCSARSTARRKSYCTPESYKGAERRRSIATAATARSRT